MENQEITFGRHPSAQLNSLFLNKPFQGQAPENARILFLSSDANYSPQISEHDFFKYILEYQEDGVRFWKKYNVHHPFLLDAYPFDKTKNGRPFHNNFRKLELDSGYAEFVSFIELLDIPTIGNKSSNRAEFFQLVSKLHLKYLDDLIQSDGCKMFLIPGGVLNDMLRLKDEYGVFQWLNIDHRARNIVSHVASNKIMKTYHFSAWQIHGQIPEIKRLIDNWLDC